MLLNHLPFLKVPIACGKDGDTHIQPHGLSEFRQWSYVTSTSNRPSQAFLDLNIILLELWHETGLEAQFTLIPASTHLRRYG